MSKRSILTGVQKDTLNVIKEYFSNHHRSPTLREVSDKLNVNLRATIDRIDALRKKGVIRKIPHKKRNLEIIDETIGENQMIQVPVVASVGADNMDVIARQEFNRFMQVEEKILDGHKDVFIVKVMGNSMKDAGINNESFVIVEAIEPGEAKNGDTVVAIIEDKAVVKELRISGNQIALIPKNDSDLYHPIIISLDREDYRIVGRVINVLDFSDKNDDYDEDYQLVYEPGIKPLE